MLLRPQLCKYECEIEFDVIKDNNFVMKRMTKICPRHQTLKDEKLIAGTIQKETDLQNAAHAAISVNHPEINLSDVKTSIENDVLHVSVPLSATAKQNLDVILANNKINIL